MDEVKDKMKGLMKKVNNPFSSSSSNKFKGPGRVLGSSSPAQSSSSSSSSSSLSSLPASKSSPQKTNKVSERKLEDKKPEIRPNPIGSVKTESGFDPFNSLITSGERNPNGYSLKVFECPVCGRGYSSEEEVSAHVESCLSKSESVNESNEKEPENAGDELQGYVSAYVSGKPSDGSIEVMIRLLRNVVKEPGNAKFRKIRIGNPKIKEAIADVPGGIEMLEYIGFELKQESDELWLVMEEPSEEVIGLTVNAISLLEPKKAEYLPSMSPDSERKKAEVAPSTAPDKVEESVQPKHVDRQIRVFFSVSESVAAKIVLPDSFYNVSAAELKREADMRKKKLEESKLLIPKSYREKQAQAAKKRYKKTLIRVQFPDGVVLQAIFSPSELTGTLYEFVSSALKDPSLEFELLHPVLVRRRVIPHFPVAGEKGVTLEDEDLVPSALIKFKPIETDDVVFTGLRNELLEISEPLVSGSGVPS